MADVLFVCTGNVCRSPSAALLFRKDLDEAGISGVTVHSAGTLGADFGPPDLLVGAARTLSIDLGAHVSRKMDPDMIESAHLVIGLAREHVREIVLSVPSSIARTFTLREIVRRGLESGPRRPGEEFGDWLARLVDGRRNVDLVGDSPEDDIVDPLGGASKDYERMLAEVRALTGSLRELGWPGSAEPARS
jgi:protein-tyrosine phosphatase